MSKGFNIFYHILTFFTIRKTEQKEPDMNHIPPIRNMETISIFSKNFAPPYTLSSIFQQHFSTNRRNSKQTRKPLYYHAKLGYYHGNCRLLRDSIISPLSPSYQRHQKRKKERPTNHSGEPLYAQKPLILSHSLILLPVSTKNPMALF